MLLWLPTIPINSDLPRLDLVCNATSTTNSALDDIIALAAEPLTVCVVDVQDECLNPGAESFGAVGLAEC